MVERQSPLEPAPLEPELRTGSHGDFEHGIDVILSETRPGSILQLAAWPGQEKELIAGIRTVTGLALPDGAGAGSTDGVRSVFGFAPGKFTVVDDAEGLVSGFA
ncbi:sarcosine oxidase subunit gamma, partial [Mesorhizobium sp. M5C.F.Ca.IN.020.14.1.1]